MVNDDFYLIGVYGINRGMANTCGFLMGKHEVESSEGLPMDKVFPATQKVDADATETTNFLVSKALDFLRMASLLLEAKRSSRRTAEKNLKAKIVKGIESQLGLLDTKYGKQFVISHSTDMEVDVLQKKLAVVKDLIEQEKAEVLAKKEEAKADLEKKKDAAKKAREALRKQQQVLKEEAAALKRRAKEEAAALKKRRVEEAAALRAKKRRVVSAEFVADSDDEDTAASA
jgi:hypothetical protein